MAAQMEFTVYRDTPKRGETDAGWCYYVSFNGHIVHIGCGYATKEKAEAAAKLAK